MSGRVFFALGALLTGIAIVANVYSWPNPFRWSLFIVGIAMIAALIGSLWYYTEHLLVRSEPASKRALRRSKALLLFFIGGVAAVMAQVMLIACSVWLGGIS